MINSNFEKPEQSSFHSSEQFRNSLTEKVKADVKQLVQQKVQEYYEQRVNTQQLEATAQTIFEMVLNGAEEEQIEGELASSAKALATRIP